MNKIRLNKEVKNITDEAILSAVLNLPREYLLSHPEVALEKNLSRKAAQRDKQNAVANFSRRAFGLRPW